MKKFKRFLRKFAKVLGVLLIIFMFAVLGLISYFYVKYKPDILELSHDADMIVSSIDSKTFKKRSPTKILNSDGEVIREFKHATYKYINFEDIPDDVKDAFISIEDKTYYSHNGIDIKANMRAVKSLINNNGEIKQGASTITQQLVKNIFLTSDKTYQRKFKEMMVAYKIEQALTKEQILEYYLNNIYFGNGAYGIETASLEYFSKSVKELDLAEITFLTAIPNNPSVYNPIKNIENTKKRQKRILNQMVLDEKITENKEKEATNKEIILNIQEKEQYLPESYEVSFVLSGATKIVMEFEGFQSKYAFKDDEERKQYNVLYNEKFKEKNEDIRMGGYDIVSTIQKDKQELLQNSINDGLGNFTVKNKESGLYETQGAGVTIDNETKEVVAIIGGRTQPDINNTFNRASLAFRQPGSIAKPIIAYAPEIDEGLLSSTILEDKVVNKGPRNAGRGYRGNVTAREALERSINTIPYNMLVKRGAKHSISYLQKMEFTNIVDRDNNAGLAIGAFTYGATPLEMAGAYGTLANNGDFIRPTGINKITFNEDLLIYENLKLAKKVYDSGTAYLITDMLKGVIRAEWGTGNGLAFSDMPMAGKTGTTDDSKDGWFAGYTPYYTTTIWVGNDRPKSIKGLYGGTYPGKIWSSYMGKIHEGLELKEFDVPNTISYMYLNPNNGEVSVTEKRGYTRYELIPHKYVMKKEEEKRVKEEKARREREEREKEAKRIEAKRLEDEMKRKQLFLEEYGVTEEVEYGYQEITKSYINKTRALKIYNEQEYATGKDYLERARQSLDVLKVETDKEMFIQKIESENQALDRRYEEFKNRIIKKEREEREQKERQAKQEVAHQQEMQRLKEERAKELEREQKRKEQIKLEKKEEDKINNSNSNNGFYKDENGYYIKKDKDKEVVVPNLSEENTDNNEVIEIQDESN